ncbi:hypothetical protein vBRpoSV10_204 [Ruegeria phage vB_RpoS-V10]|nr:hypothetical protein DSS3P8_199 [Roseobacter phage DSS3P8]AWY09326.1 hypothetical protein vBRpoSV10_204 [Ruegeria phage vB_RpoS-V10]
MSTAPTRPTWNTTAVMEEASRLIYGDVKAWADNLGAIPDGVDEREVLAVVTLAIMESADCYEAGRYLESFCDFPTNGDLIRILDRAYLSMPRLVPPYVRAWVMENAVRFAAKEGDQVLFKIGDAEVRGTCVGAVPTEARGFVEIAGTKRGQVVPVNGEDLIKVTKAKAAPAPNGGGFPTGGTPVASRGGAELRKASA